MKGILKEKSEIEKLRKEYQMFSEFKFNFEKDSEKSNRTKKELVLEDCES
ncbi:hypothetical protein [Flavobacterium sandaracinum]|nr:hypothetical protein [Flavobacterium sandaracinum]